MARLIASTELKERLGTQDVLVVDVGSAEDYARAHIPGAIHIPLESLRETVRERRQDFAKREYIVVYAEGHDIERSTEASRILEEMGFDRVGNFDGGREAWHNAGYQLET